MAAKLLNIKEAEQQGVSERTAAKINEVARSTARYWKKRYKSLRENSGLAPEVIEFLWGFTPLCSVLPRIQNFLKV